MPDSCEFSGAVLFRFCTHIRASAYSKCKQYYKTSNHKNGVLLHTFAGAGWFGFFLLLLSFDSLDAFLRAQSLFSHFYFRSPCEIEFIFAYILIYVWHCPYKVNEWVCVCYIFYIHLYTMRYDNEQWQPIKPSILIPYSAFLAWKWEQIFSSHCTAPSPHSVLSSFHLIVSLVVIFQLLCERQRHNTHTNIHHLRRQNKEKNKSKIP